MKVYAARFLGNYAFVGFLIVFVILVFNKMFSDYDKEHQLLNLRYKIRDDAKSNNYDKERSKNTDNVTVNNVTKVAKMLYFITKEDHYGWCDEALITKLDTFDHPNYIEYKHLLIKHGEHLKSIGAQRLEGNCASYPDKILSYWYIVQLPFIKTVCETGFNAGHSTLLWLAVNKLAKVYSFDIGDHDYARPMSEYLQNMFPGRLTITWGDSSKTIPEFQRAHPDIKCDLMIVDGGHSKQMAFLDMGNFRNMASDINLMVMDDHPALSAKFGVGPGKAWENSKASGELFEYLQCTTRNMRHGFSLGMLLNV